MRLSTRITLLCAAAVLPSLGIQAWHEVKLRQARLEDVRAEARRFALQSASEVNRMIEGARNMLAAVGEAHLRGGIFPGCAEGLAALTARMPRYVSIGVSNAEGQVVCSSAGGAGPGSIAGRPYFQAARASLEFEVGAPMTLATASGAAPRRILPVALPFQSGGRFAGVAIASFDSDWLSTNLVASGALPEGGSVTVADRHGTIAARFPQPESFVGTRIPEAYADLLRAGSPGVLDVVSQDGTARVLGYVPVGAASSGLYVSAGFATAPALAEADRATRRALLLVLAGLLSALAAAWLFGRLSLRDPVDRLLDVMRRWAAGDHGARSDFTDRWEIGRLAAGFNAMADAVAVREQHLREGEARLRDVLGQMPVAVVLAEIPSGRVVFRNARAEALLPDGEAAGATTDPLAEPLRRAIAEGRATEDLELPLRRADGSETVLSVSAAPVRAAGGVRLAVAAFLDVGARRHAERQRELLTAELRHRVKNALAVVQSMVAQTLAQSTSLDEFRRSFTARLTLLARAQDALFAAEDGCVQMEALVAITLAPFGAAARAEGPDVALPAKQTLSLAMVLHEMATNAAKHGALRPGSGGHIAVTWSVRRNRDSEDEQVELVWAECSGTQVTETGRRGFGGRLIERCVQHDLRGRAESTFDPAGISWRLSFPKPNPSLTPLPEFAYRAEVPPH
jgi:two-component sensor histidine kinase